MQSKRVSWPMYVWDDEHMQHMQHTLHTLPTHHKRSFTPAELAEEIRKRKIAALRSLTNGRALQLAAEQYAKRARDLLDQADECMALGAIEAATEMHEDAIEVLMKYDELDVLGLQALEKARSTRQQLKHSFETH
jgi:hypothetical protein